MINKIVEGIKSKMYQYNMGAGKLSRLYTRKLGELVTREDIYKAKLIIKENKVTNNFPKILIFDIETTPLLAYVFQKEVWKARISNNKIISDWLCLTWSAKWLYNETIMSDRLAPEEIKVEDDSRIVKSLWNLFNEADIVVAHNGRRFDIANMNAKFVSHQIMPPSPYIQIDTLDVAKRQFGFTHNNLDFICSTLGINGKIETDFELWKECIRGNIDALIEMETYNKNDVLILEEVYLRLRPYIKSHPNVGLYLDTTKPVCPSCGHTHLTSLDKPYYTQTGVFNTLRCDNCGSIARQRTSIISKEKRSNLVVSIAR